MKESYTRVWRMAWPATLESLLVAVIGFVDTIMVSSLGAGAISAVGITTQPKFLLMAPIMALNVGLTAIVARRRGEGDMAAARRALKQGMILSFALSTLMVLLSFFLAEPLLNFAGAQPDYLKDAVDYFRIVLCGQFFGCLGMTVNAAQRGYGNTRISMYANTAANLINILLNWLLIGGVWFFPRLGVRGAAVATAVGSFLSLAISLYSVLHTRHDGLNITGSEPWRFDRRTMQGIVKVSSSTLVEQGIMRFGFFAFALIIAKLGTKEFAVHQICMNIVHISFALADGLGIAATSLVGQNLGAKRPDLALMYGRMCQRISMTVGIILSILFILLRYQLVGLFSDDPYMIKLGADIVLIIAVICMLQTVQVVMLGALRGAGDARYVAVISLISVGLIRAGVSYILCYPLGLGLIGAWLGMLIDQSVRSILSSTRFKSGKWAKIEL